MRLEHWKADTDGPLTEESMRRRLEEFGYRVMRYVYPPGTYFGSHTHDVDKIDAVLAGRFRMTLEGAVAVLGAGDYLFVPRGAEHTAEVLGNEPVVSLDAVKG